MPKYSTLNEECETTLLWCKKNYKLIKKEKKNKNVEKQNGVSAGLLKS